MNRLFFTAAILFYFATYGQSQQSIADTDTIKVIVENDKVKVTEFVSTPGKDICGKGKHTHAPHLSILLTDAKVTVTTHDGTKIFDVKAGAAFWSDTETHIAINSGSNIARAYTVEVK
ncbi:MAG: hypothetical protein JNK79_02505 [Chitinophagaceae bacterium]|nr:hypothetical protein [Chitinophagaceae bacterium]